MHGGRWLGGSPKGQPTWQARARRAMMVELRHRLGLVSPGGRPRSAKTLLKVSTRATRGLMAEIVKFEIAGVVPLRRLDKATIERMNPAELLGATAHEGLLNLAEICLLPKPDLDDASGDATKRLRLIGDMSVAANNLLRRAAQGDREQEVLAALLDQIKSERAKEIS